jgi:hypothetical protein
MRLCPVSGRRVFVSSLIAALCIAAPAAAQEGPATPPVLDLRNALAAPVVEPAAQAPSAAQLIAPAAKRDVGPKRPAALMPLYVSYVGLQGLDIHSTKRGMSSGTTRESNPLMKPFVDNDAAFIAVKASATAGTIFVTEKLRKKRPKTAVALAIAFNAAMALVVTHNYRVAR